MSKQKYNLVCASCEWVFCVELDRKIQQFPSCPRCGFGIYRYEDVYNLEFDERVLLEQESWIDRKTWGISPEEERIKEIKKLKTLIKKEVLEKI